MPHLAPADTANLVAQAQQTAHNAEQQSVALLMQRMTPSVIAHLALNTLIDSAATAAMEFVSKMELVEKLVDLEAQLKQKLSNAPQVSKFSLMTERNSRDEPETETLTSTAPKFS